MKLFIIFTAFFACISTLSSPDVYFSDSDKYDGAYLSNEFDGNKVKFVLTGKILDFSMPNKFYDIDDLLFYIENTYIFSSQTIKNDFINMLQSSFQSQFKAKEFLNELLNMLNSFKG